MLGLKSMAYVVALARHGHFGEAAEHLNITQSALSQGIAALERQLGVRLFDRDRNGVRITAAGRLVVERAEALLTGEAELRREVDLLRGLETGALAVGAGPHAGDLLVAPALARLAGAHPGLQVRVSTGYFQEIFDLVLKGTVEVGVSDIAAWRSESRLEFTSLGRHPIILACRPGHPLAGRRGVTLPEAWSYPLAAPLLTGAVAGAVPARCAAGRRDEATGHFVPAYCTESVPVALAIARSSDALFAGPMALIRQDLDAGLLVTVDVSLAAIDLEYGAYSLRGRTLSPGATRFLASLRDAAAGIGREAAGAAHQL
jgi:DNA-binding transcriptional LysR family regulator